MRHLTLALAAALSLGATAALAAPTYEVTGKIAGADGGWDLLAVDAHAERLYVARGDGLMAVDLKSGKVENKLVPLQRGHGAAVIPGTGRVIAASGGDNTAILLDGATGKVIATIATPKNPDAIAYDPATKTVWIMCPGAGSALVVDPMSGKVLATVQIGGSLELGAADGHGKMYVNVEDKNELVVLDTRARKVLKRIPLKGCDGPTGIIYSAKAHQILSACGGNAVAVVTSTTSGHTVATLKIGKGADGAAFDATRDVALVPAGRDGNISVIRLGAKPRVMSTVQTAASARTIAIDERTGRLYLPSAQFGASTGKGRPPMVPGSFAVIVVSPKG
jgi:DNA-binding beta-propeller fold protein YncE